MVLSQTDGTVYKVDMLEVILVTMVNLIHQIMRLVMVVHKILDMHLVKVHQALMDIILTVLLKEMVVLEAVGMVDQQH